MKNETKVKAISDKEATKIVLKLKSKMSVNDLAHDLDMSKMTLYSRLRSGNWAFKEKLLIEKLDSNG